MELVASSAPLAVLLLAVCATASGCPDPEAQTTVIITVQDETAQQALTASVNVTSFVLTDVGEEYITLFWMPALLTGHAAGSQVCTYMLTFNYLGMASGAGGSPATTMSPRGPFSMHTVQYTNNTIATHHGLPPFTPVRVALHVCLLVNASTMVCVHVADANATTRASSGSSSTALPSATMSVTAYTASMRPPQQQLPQPIATQPPQTTTSAASVGSAEVELAMVSSTAQYSAAAGSGAGSKGSDAGGSGSSDGGQAASSGMAGVAIVAATVIILTAVGVAGATYLVYRHCRTRWEPLPSHFWTVELQSEYDSVSFTDASGRAGVMGPSNSGGGGSRGRPADDADVSDQRCRLLDDHRDGPYKLLTA